MPRRPAFLAILIACTSGTALLAGAAEHYRLGSGVTRGPDVVRLWNDVGELAVPDGHSFAGPDVAYELFGLRRRLLGDRVIGVIVPTDAEQDWFVLLEYYGDGYVRVDERERLNARSLERSIRRTLKAEDELRRSSFARAMRLDGWQRRPSFDSATHRLSWALRVVDLAGEAFISETVCLLGRDGYTLLRLQTRPDSYDLARQHLQLLADGFSFLEGRRYADHADGDPVSKLGLAGIVAGGPDSVQPKPRVNVEAVVVVALLILVAALRFYIRWSRHRH